MAKKSTGAVEKMSTPAESGLKSSLDYGRSGMVNSTVMDPEFTGVSRSVECYYNQGHNNFRVLTLYIEKGKVVKMEVSDAYAQFECIDKLNYWNELAMTNLNSSWVNKKALQK